MLKVDPSNNQKWMYIVAPNLINMSYQLPHDYRDYDDEY